MTADHEFIIALGRGQRWALERFYHQLRNAKNDADFWDTLSALIPQAVAARQRPRVDRLKEHLDSPDFRQFLQTVPVHLLASFMMLAMLVSACSKAEPTTASSASADLGPANTANQPPPAASSADATGQPAAGDSTSATGQPPAADSATATAETEKPQDVQTMTSAELKAELAKYINQAQLPASEKRRLKQRLATATEPVVIKSRSQLAKLFKENDPQRIAVLLEQMVMFQRYQPHPPKPIAKPRYKGVDFL